MKRLRMHDQAIRFMQTEIDERRREVDQIEKMIEEFNRMIDYLDHEIEAEHRRTGIYDRVHLAYSTFARAATQRRDNLKTSIADLQRQLRRSAAAIEQLKIDLDRVLNNQN